MIGSGVHQSRNYVYSRIHLRTSISKSLSKQLRHSVPATLTLHSIQHHFLFFQARRWLQFLYWGHIIMWSSSDICATLWMAERYYVTLHANILSHHASVTVLKGKYNLIHAISHTVLSIYLSLLRCSTMLVRSLWDQISQNLAHLRANSHKMFQIWVYTRSSSAVIYNLTTI